MNTVPFRAALLSGLLLTYGPAAFSQPLTFNTLAGYAGQGSADGLSSNARNSNPSGIAAEDAWCFMLSVLSDAPRSMEVIGGSGNSPLGAEGYESAGHHLGLAWHEDQGSVTAR
jgi:hypothetical protein